MTIAVDESFTPPGKGQWMSLRDHFPHAVTPEYARLLPTAMAVGEAIPFATYGLPIKTLSVGLVHGHVYVTPEPLVGRAGDSLPPWPFLWLAARLVPAFRARTRAARRALTERPWLAEAEHWYAHERDEWRAKNAALQAEDPDGMDPETLIDHLRRVRAHAGAGYERHFSLHGPDLIPTGLLLARAEDWGIPAAAVLPVLAGSSPASTGSGPTLDALRAAVARSGSLPTSVDDLRRLAPRELDAFLAEHGWRLTTGYDLNAEALGELPALIVHLARAPGRPPVEDAAGAGADPALDDLRARVPAAHRSELERLVADARATFGMRDDNGGLTGAWPMGLLRRAMLAAGRHLADAGALEQAEHAIEVTVDELCAVLAGASTPDASMVAERAGQRAARSALVPPAQLGPTLDVPLRALPGPMRMVSHAQLALRDSFASVGAERAELAGDGVGGGRYQGRACVATDSGDALARLEPGDVLVALGTTPAFNMALSIAGAVVVEEGGLLSHAAVIARELGLPAVIGAVGATAQVPDGALVEVDAVAGQVRVLAVP